MLELRGRIIIGSNLLATHYRPTTVISKKSRTSLLFFYVLRVNVERWKVLGGADKYFMNYENCAHSLGAGCWEDVSRVIVGLSDSNNSVRNFLASNPSAISNSVFIKLTFFKVMSPPK